MVRQPGTSRLPPIFAMQANVAMCHKGIGLLGDLLAYIDVFAMIFLLSMIGRAGMALYVIKRTVERTIQCVNAVLIALRRFDFRHPRATGLPRRGVGGGAKNEDDGCMPVDGFAWGVLV
jgi:hypothetical protein